MSSGGTTAAVTGGVALLERAMGYTLGSLQLVTPASMSRPTPCSEWDLRALLLHMNESLHTLHEVVAVGHLELDPAADVGDPAGDYGDPVTDPVATLRNRGCRMIGAWANAREPGAISVADRAVTPGIVAATGAVEIAVHGWDVSRATGQERPIPAAFATELLELCQLLLPDVDRPGRFAPPVDVRRRASSGDRLLAFLGRQPH
jgi:uncharacterized protein (TIGR03086 family)